MIKIATHQIGDIWTDGTPWSDMGLGLPSNISPSIKVFNNKVYLRFETATDALKYRLYTSNDGITLNPDYIQLPTGYIYSYILGDNNRLFISGMSINSENGVWYTDDNGENWVKTLSAPYMNTFFRSSRGTLFVENGSTSWRSTDNGVTWAECGYMPQYETSTGKLIHFEGAQTYTSTDDGVSWALASEISIQGHNLSWNTFESFAISDAGIIFRAVYDDTDEYQLLFKSTDECNSWEYLGYIPNSHDDSKIYAAGNRLLHTTYYATESGGGFIYHYVLYASDDSGNTWNLLHTTEAGGVADIKYFAPLNHIRAISITNQNASCMRHSDVTTETVALKYLDKDATRELIDQAIGYVDNLVN